MRTLSVVHSAMFVVWTVDLYSLSMDRRNLGKMKPCCQMPVLFSVWSGAACDIGVD